MEWDAFFAMAFTFALIWKWMDMRRPGQALRPLRGKAAAQQQTQQLLQGSGSAAELELAKLKMAEQRERRALYEKLATEKLDVMRTAISMGYKEAELMALDERLERLIGSEKLGRLMEHGEVPPPTSDLLDSDLDSEIARLQQLRSAKSPSSM